MKRIICLFSALAVLMMCCACSSEPDGTSSDTSSVVSTVPDIIYDSSVQVKVPDLVGMNFEKAQEQYGKDIVIIADWQYSDTVEYGAIVSQATKAGDSVAQGTKIEVVISKGKKPADTTSTGSGGVASTASSKVSSSTSSGAFTGDGTVGDKYVTMADITNMPKAQALIVIHNLGLNVGNIVEAVKEGMPAGYVIAQSKPKGMILEKGSTVDLVISKEGSVSSGLEEQEIIF